MIMISLLLHVLSMHPDSVNTCVVLMAPITLEPEENSIGWKSVRMYLFESPKCLGWRERMDVVCEICQTEKSEGTMSDPFQAI